MITPLEAGKKQATAKHDADFTDASRADFTVNQNKQGTSALRRSL
jgi:hypothetical protein